MSKKTSKKPFSGKKVTGVQKPQIEKKSIRLADTTSGYYDKYPRWMFQRCDFDHPKWGMTPNAGELTKVFKYLSNLENRKWGDILTDKSGRRNNTRNHHIELSDILSEAQKRAVAINVDEFDTLCSIAVGGRERVWGYISDGVFYIIWFDMQHEIYPYEKQNT